jgi:hypothetical protein
MKLKPIIIMAIKGNTELRLGLRNVLRVSNPTMTRLLQDNDDDLTKAAALELLRNTLNLSDEEILDREPVVEGQN